MTNSQKLQIRQSEIRERLNQLSAPEAESTDETKSEVSALLKELSDSEPKLRAAITAEQAEIEDRNSGNSNSSDPKLDDLRKRASVSEYIRQAVSGSVLEGACRELNDELKITAVRGQGGGVLMPVEQLAFRAANTTTTAADADETQRRPIFSRLFANPIMDAMGVRLDSVPVGLIEYPILTDASDPAMVAEDADAAEPDAATWNSEVLKPKRLIASYEFTAEAVLTIPGLDAALASDLSMSMTSQMNKEVITGDGTGANVRGLDTAITFPDDPTAKVVQNDALAWPYEVIDGLHASTESDVSIVLGPETYKVVAQTMFPNTTENIFDVFRKRGISFTSSAHIEGKANAVPDTIEKIYIHGGRDMARGDSVGAVWPAMELIRDPYTKAKSSKTVITAVMLWDLYAGFRGNAYKGAKAKVDA